MIFTNPEAAATMNSLRMRWEEIGIMESYEEAGYCLDATDCIPAGGAVAITHPEFGRHVFWGTERAQ